MSYPLPSIPYLRLQVTLEAEEPASLPPYHGSMLRGAFGHALRRSVCTLGPSQPCASCLLRQACAYTRLFETFVEGEPPPFLRGIDQAVRPLVFEPHGGPGRLQPGDPLRFDLLLLGQAVELQAYAILALERMARAGLGSGRARFQLARIEAPDPDGPTRLLFSQGSPPARTPARPSHTSLKALPDGPITLRFTTPLRLKVRDRLTDRLRFRDLAFYMLRRTLELAHLHVPGAAVDWTFQPLLRQADAIQVSATHVRWYDWERWSHRQQTAMKLGGLLGTLTLQGDLTPFAPLLRTAEIVHIGKGATFGLGKMEVCTGTC